MRRPPAVHHRGRSDAPGCSLAQPDFASAPASGYVIFRIPRPGSRPSRTRRVPENRNGNDSTITRFGWKAQNKSLQIVRRRGLQCGAGRHQRNFSQSAQRSARLPFQQGFGGLDQFGSGASSDLILFAAFLRLLSDHLLDDLGPGLAGIAHCAFVGAWTAHLFPVRRADERFDRSYRRACFSTTCPRTRSRTSSTFCDRCSAAPSIVLDCAA